MVQTPEERLRQAQRTQAERDSADNPGKIQTARSSLSTPGTSYAEDRTLRQNNVLRRPVGQSADAETLTEMTKLKTLERAAKDEGISNLRNHTHKSTANEALVGQRNKIARHGLEGGAQSDKNGKAVSKVGQNRRDNLVDNLRLLDKVTKGEEIDPGISAEKKKAAAQSGGNLATGQNYYVNGVDVRDLTDDEAATYSYWFQRDKKRADEYLKAIRTDVNRRTYERENETMKQASKEHPVAAGIAGNILSAYAAPAAGIAGLGAKITGQPYNPYSKWNTGVNMGDATAAGLTEDIRNPVGKFLASTGLSTAQFLAKLPLGTASLAFTALGSGGQTMNEAKQKGATTDQAIQLGVIAGAAEALTEKIPLDNILAAFKGTKKRAVAGALQSLLKSELGAILGSTIEEGSEELITEYINNLADLAIMGKESDYKQYEKQLIEMGYDEKTAAKKAALQYYVVNPLVSFAGGALSGGVMAGAGALTNNAGNIIDAAKQKYLNSKIDSDYKNVPTDVTIDLTKQSNGNSASADVKAEPKNVDVSDLLSDSDIIEAINSMPNLVNTASETTQKKPIRNIGDVKLDETYVSGIRHKATAEEINLAQLIGKTFGRKVEFSDEGGINGRFDGDTIFINTKASDTMPTVISHELLHSIEGYEGYNNVIDSLKQVAAARGQDWDSMTADIFDKYNAKYQGEGRQLTDADCDAEAAANMISTILGDEKTLTDFVRQNRSAAARMWTHLRRAVTRLGENIRNAASYMFMPAGADGERDLKRQSRMQAQALKRVTEDACDKLAKALRATKGTKTTGQTGNKYSFADQKIPTYEELIKKPDMKIIDIGAEDTSRSYKEQRKDFLNSEVAARLYKEPVVNIDTGEMVFITQTSLTHTFSNDAKYKLQTVEHIKEIIENAVLTHAEPPTHGANNTAGVYTLFAAVRTDKGIQPVKIKVKEYKLVRGSQLPKEITEYFGENGIRDPYASMYDGKVLELDSIETVEKKPADAILNSVTAKSPSGEPASINYPSSASVTAAESSSVSRNSDNSARYEHPSSATGTADAETEKASTISIADFIPLVKGDPQRYLPKTKKDGVTQATHAPQKNDAFAITPETQLASPPSKKDGITQVSNAPHKASTPDYTSETGLPSLPSDNSISQSDGNVKGNGENNSKYSINDTSDDTTRPKNADEARNRKKAIEMFNDGADADVVYQETGWRYNELGKLSVDRDAEVYTGKKKGISKKEEAKLREYIADLQKENEGLTDMIASRLTSDEAEQIRRQTREEVMRDLGPDSKRSPDYVPSREQAKRIINEITSDNHTRTQKSGYVKELLSLYDRASETDSNGVRAMSDTEIADAFDKLANKIQDSDIATDKASTEQAAELKKELHTPIFLSEKARGDISEGYGKFRKQYYGKLNLVSKAKGTPVDVRYEELSSAYPEWFPADIVTESDQLFKMAEVYDTIADPDYGKSSIYDFSGWEAAYKDDHAKIVGQLAEGFRHMETTPKTAVDRVLAANEQKQRLTEEAHQKLMDDTVAELTQDFQDELREQREYYETLDANKDLIHQEELANQKQYYNDKEQKRLDREAEAKAEREMRRHRRGGDIDKDAVAEAHKNGQFTEKMTQLYERRNELSKEFEPYAEIDVNQIEDKDIRAHAKDLKERLDDMNVYINRVGQVVKDIRRDHALEIMAKGNIYKWKDKKSGILYSIETMPRNIRDISGGDELGENMISEYFTPISQDVATGNRLKKQYRDRIRELDISQKVKSGDKLSESQFIQLYGEAVSNIEMLESESGALLKNSGGELTRAGYTIDEWKGILDTLALENPGIAKDMDKVKNAVKVFRKSYDELLPQINQARVLAGYAPIEYHAGYFPHFSGNQGDSVLSQMLQVLGVKPGDVGGLPTSINGLTGTFRPGIRYMSNAKSRNLAGDGGQFSGTTLEAGMGAVEGFEKYLSTAADVITLTDDIQNLRALSDAMRYSGSSDGVKKQADEIRKDDRFTTDQKQSVLDSLYDSDNKFRLRNFVVELEEYTNLLAGKRSMHDRAAEQYMGRGMYNLVKKFESRVAANMVSINPGSWLTNFSPLVQGGATMKQQDILLAMLDTIKAVKNDDGFRTRSDFLTNRFADSSLVEQTTGQKLSETLGKPMEWIDGFTSETLVRARYSQNKRKGLSDVDAMHEADTFIAGMMAGRSKGEMPTIFEQRSPVTKLFTQFQLEVNNQIGWMFKDLPREAGKKAVGKLLGMLFKYSIGAWLFNEAYEALVGRRCAFDPADILLGDFAGDVTGYGLPSGGKLWDAIKDIPDVALGKQELGDVINRTFKRDQKSAVGTVGDLAENVAESLPFTSFLGLFVDDFDQGRIPVSASVPNLTNAVKALDPSNGYGKKKRNRTLSDELLKPVYYAAFPFGGGQVKKVLEGSEYIARGGSYKPDNDGNPQLQYPLYNDNTAKTIWESGKALVFGKTSTEGGKEWTENGFKRESAKATAAYKAFENGGMTRREALNAVHEIKNASKRADKVRALRNVDAESSAKIEAFRNLITDEQDDRIAYIKRAKIDFDDYLKIYDSYLNNNGLGKKTTVVADIQKLNLTKEQKDTLFLCFYKETTLKDTPWHTFGITIPMAPEFEMPELPKIDLP
jgi:hypothetical protein